VTVAKNMSNNFQMMAGINKQWQKFGGTYFAGNTVYLPSELNPAIEYRRGKLFSQERFEDTIRGIQDKYADTGYLKAVVAPERTYNELTGETELERQLAILDAPHAPDGAIFSSDEALARLALAS
jgi:outer membrane protein assembly factor BamA